MLKVLLICDDLWHPAEVIERGLASMDTEDIEFDLVKTAKDILSPDMLDDYDVVMTATGNAVNVANCAPWFEEGTECGPEAFRDYVERGGGLLAVHAGIAIFRDAVPVYNNLVGAYFINHPPRELVHVHVTAQTPITQGVEDFAVSDEHYQIAVTAQDAQYFLECRSSKGGTFPGGYMRECGKGRVALITPGHTLAVWQNSNYQTLIKNALRWCAKRK